MAKKPNTLTAAQKGAAANMPTEEREKRLAKASKRFHAFADIFDKLQDQGKDPFDPRNYPPGVAPAGLKLAGGMYRSAVAGAQITAEDLRIPVVLARGFD